MDEAHAHTTPILQGEYYRTGEGGGTEDGCKGQTPSHHCRTWWRDIRKWTEINNLFLNSKPNKLDRLSLLSVCVFPAVGLTPVPFMVNGLPRWSRAEQRETDSPVQVSLRAATAAGRRDTEADRKTLSSSFTSSSPPDRINRQKALWLHWTALKRLSAWTHREEQAPLPLPLPLLCIHSPSTHWPVSFSTPPPRPPPA